LSPEVITLVIQRAGRMGKPPEMGQRVRIKGRDEVFFVVRVDQRRQLADLVQATGTHVVEENVPFQSIVSTGDERGKAGPEKI
jgi:hypothetical protein